LSVAAAIRAQRRSSTLISAFVLSVLLLAVIYTAVTYSAIAHQADQNEVRHADVIVVFGAAEYAGHPSPVYRARLEHGLALFQQGVAPYIITTGGQGDDPTYTEGGVGRSFLVSQGVPESRIIAETQSDDTSESSERIAGIMRANDMKSAVVVSDGYHIYRIKQMMARQGIDQTFGSPRPLARPLTGRQKLAYYLREVLSITLWRLHLT